MIEKPDQGGFRESEKAPSRPEHLDTETETGVETETGLEQQQETERRDTAEELEKARQHIPGQADVIKKPKPVYEQYLDDTKNFKSTEPKKAWRRILSFFNRGQATKLYSQFPQVTGGGNDPENDSFYLKEVDRYNERQERRAEDLGYNHRVAFLSHIHSRGVEDWKDGSDGSLTPEQILAEYRKAVDQLKEQGIEQVFVTITDHQAAENSIKLAELLEKEGVATPIVGVEAANSEGYEVLGYTTDREKLRAFQEFLEQKKSRLVRYGKTGHTGEEVVKRMAEDGFAMGLSHPSAKKTITLGGAMIERFAKDPELKELMERNMCFYEALNWFQNVSGSNCLSFSMGEDMEAMNIMPFAGEDFHSKVSGSEDKPFNGMYTEIRTGQEITGGENFLELLRQQKTDPGENPGYLTMLRGRPALAQQYDEHINNAASRAIPDTFRAIFDLGRRKKE